MDYVIGLGSNLGSRRAHLQAALALLRASGMRIARVSSLYESDPVGPPQPRYYNAAARVEAELPAHALLARLLAIEAQLGRVRDPAQRWHARTIDLDVLWSAVPVQDAELTVPHAQLRARWFALAPLLEVAPELASEYGAALSALGGAPARSALGALDRPQGEGCATAHGVLAEAVESHGADALAAALGALGRCLWPVCGITDIEVVAGPVHGEPAAEFVRAALARAAHGFAFRLATVCELGPERFSGRLIGVRAPAFARPAAFSGIAPALRGGAMSMAELTEHAVEGGVRVAIRLAP
jgi:2-amino-4-hydroxy-6-hydroxymethyldihydropteridine diphosphokinase